MNPIMAPGADILASFPSPSVSLPEAPFFTLLGFIFEDISIGFKRTGLLSMIVTDFIFFRFREFLHDQRKILELI